MKSERSIDKNRTSKRAQFSSAGEKRASGKPLPKIVAGAVFLLLLFGGFRMFSGGRDTTETASAASAVAGQSTFKELSATTAVAIPVAEVNDGKARFYSYKAGDGRDVKFFVMKSSDGVYRAALDTCDVCYRAKKGYVQHGDQMVCRKCGQSFPSALVNDVSGGCNPVPVERRIENGNIVIAATTLENAKNYF